MIIMKKDCMQIYGDISLVLKKKCTLLCFLASLAAFGYDSLKKKISFDLQFFSSGGFSSLRVV